MKKIYFLSLLFLAACNPQLTQKSSIVQNDDVERFWLAFDLIQTTDDFSKQVNIIKEKFIKPGSPGLHALMDKRSYTAESYVKAINDYPKFWASIRANTLKSDLFAQDIEENIAKLKNLYPDLKSAQVYFTVGALMTGGQAHKGHVLIGSEIAMADSTIFTQELQPDRLRENLAKHFHTNPINDVVLLNVHEYVHTQQGDYGTDLLSMSIFEGVAEFVSVLAAETKSAAPAIPFGQANETLVRERFQKEMFSPNWNDWLYNDRENEFKVRDMGYYVGYAICEKYYQQSKDKMLAIKEMIELDCADEIAVKEFVIKSKYLSKPYESLKTEYHAQQPKVLGIKEFENESREIDHSLKKITIEFSTSMNTRFRNFKFASFARKKIIPYQNMKWSEDGKSLVLEVKLEANKKYKMIIDSEFRDLEGRAIEKYLIDFSTKSI